MRAILTYHSIDDTGSAISVPRAVFERHVRWLASGAVRVVSLEQIVRLNDDVDAVAVTFDDGFASVGTIAAPLLAEHRLPATIFVVTAQVGQTNAWGGRRDRGIPVLPLLDWQGLARAVEAGLALGAHSRTHPDLTAIGGGAAHDEIAGSVEDLARHIGVRPTCFAYPYGRVDDTVAEMTSTLCEHAFTADLRVLGASDRRARLPRLDAYYFQGEGWLEAWGQPRFRAYVGGRRILRRVRQAVLS